MKRLLLPDPVDGGSALPPVPDNGVAINPATTAIPENVEVEQPARLSATDALGLEEKPSEELKSFTTGIEKKQLPKILLKPREEKKPVEEKPAATPPVAKPEEKPAAPVVKPEEKPVVPAPEEKDEIKIGNKTYTKAQLEALLAKETEVKPEQTPAPVVPETKPPTPEEIQKAETEYVNGLSKTIPLNITKEEVEAILVGGDEGVQALVPVLQKVAANAVMHARKSIYDEMNPMLAKFEQAQKDILQQIGPVVLQQEQLQRVTTEQEFLKVKPEYSGNDYALESARKVAEALVKNYRPAVEKMTIPEFIAEVDKQTTAFLNGQVTKLQPSFKGGWREWYASQKPAATPAATTPAAIPAATPAAAPGATTPAATVKPPKPQPLTANTPGAMAPGKPNKDWNKATAATLVD